MSNPIVITQTQTQSCELNLNSAYMKPTTPIMRDPPIIPKTTCLQSEKRGDSLYGVARKVPDQVLVAARKEAGRDKTSIECVVGQRDMFKQLMAETTQKREQEWNPAHEKVVDDWSALLPQPAQWSDVLGKRKRRTKQKMYVADKKKQKVEQQMSDLAASYYEYDK